MKQKQINKMLKNIKCKREVYNKFGTIVKITLCHVLIFIDFFVPTFRLLSAFALKFTKHIELFRITIRG